MRWPIKGRDQSRLKSVRSLLRALRAENTPEARGRRLLRDWLSVGQREQFDAARYFDVTGSDSGQRYRICYGTAANIRELDRNGKEGIGWCFAPVGALVPTSCLRKRSPSSPGIGRQFPINRPESWVEFFASAS